MKQAYIKLHIALIVAGFTGIFGKLITLNAVLISWYRLLLSFIILFIFLVAKRGIAHTTTKQKLQIGFTGFLLGLHWLLFYGSIKYSNISVGVVCFALSSFFNAIFAPFIQKKKLVKQELLLSGLTLCGIALIFGMDAGYRTGIILGVISSMFSAFYTLSCERIVKQYDGPTFMMYQMGGGFIGLSMLAPIFFLIYPNARLLPSNTDLWWLICLAAFCTVLMYVFINDALKKISSFTISLTFNLEPLYTILLAALIYHEGRELSLGFYAGVSLILTSLVFQTYTSYRAGKQKATMS